MKYSLHLGNNRMIVFESRENFGSVRKTPHAVQRTDKIFQDQPTKKNACDILRSISERETKRWLRTVRLPATTHRERERKTSRSINKVIRSVFLVGVTQTMIALT